MNDEWTLVIHSVTINANNPGSVSITITPTEHALLKAQRISRKELSDSYRWAIECGNFTTFSWI